MSKRSQRRKKNKVTVQSTETYGFFDVHYKKFIFIPFILLLLASAQIGYQTYTTGDFISKGVSLAGGTSITIDIPLDIFELKNHLREEFQGSDIRVREIASAGRQIGVIVETTKTEEADRQRVLDEIAVIYPDLDPSHYAVEVIGPSLGQAFFKQIFTALLFAFILMAIIVFIFFRTIVPSISIILAVITDIVVTAAVVNLLDLRLSTAGIAAFLMLIGYAVDTNILLSNKLIKNTGPLFLRVKEAFKTGGFMTLTTLSALFVALLFTQSDVIRQITLIVFIGLIVDFMTTWFQNAGILRFYLEKKGDTE